MNKGRTKPRCVLAKMYRAFSGGATKPSNGPVCVCVKVRKQA
jgi:hypothetical protein